MGSFNNSFKDDEHKISEAEKQNWQMSKNRKRQKRILSDAEIMQFANLLAANSPLNKFETEMGLSNRDVGEQKNELGLHDMDDAREFLNAVKRKQQNRSVVEHETSKVENQEAKYESISDYTNKTGKRFRMTKSQKQRGLDRDQAFAEFNNGNS